MFHFISKIIDLCLKLNGGERARTANLRGTKKQKINEKFDCAIARENKKVSSKFRVKLISIVVKLKLIRIICIFALCLYGLQAMLVTRGRMEIATNSREKEINYLNVFINLSHFY